MALSWPACRHSICTDGARVAATLAAGTVFSHVLGEGIAAHPGRGVMIAACVHLLPWLLELDPGLGNVGRLPSMSVSCAR